MEVIGKVTVTMSQELQVAKITIQFKFGFSSAKTIGLTPQAPLFGPPGYEIILLYIAGLMALIISGAGVFSSDAWLAKNRTVKSK